ncbi:MAG: hypothetical protein EXR72_13790 [Myxococcales bacterium]|nr:hypothetical protein [Myxococcales bacterium]
MFLPPRADAWAHGRRHAALALSLLLASCYAYDPNPPNGTQDCAPDHPCPNAYVCAPDAKCYKLGEQPTPDLRVASDLAGPPRDLAVKPPGDLSTNCGPCVGTAPVCNPKSGLCVPCLPTSDLCPDDAYCIPAGESFQCVPGCKKDSSCPGTDGGPKPVCCNHVCANVATDGANCGKCGTACNGTACCGGACVDLAKSPTNCGGCGNICPPGTHGTNGCIGGACAVTGCEAGYGDCDKSALNGCEAALANDPANCLGCGTKCAAPNGVAVCMGGCAISACVAGFADCNKLVGDGCEVATSLDPGNCGGCGKACPAPPNSVGACNGGVCGVGGCLAGFGNCDNNPVNGCETPVGSDLANCGACGAKCAAINGTASCLAGICTVASCTAPFTDCNKSAVDGCEANLASDVNNCKVCGAKCTVANGLPACASGVCAVASCSANFADCNKLQADGCEVSLLGDPMSCGGCGKLCPALPNAAPGCTAAMCSLGACNANFGNCDNLPANGCEASVAADVNNCGGCGKKCVPANGTGACAAGVCNVATCVAPFGDCNKLGADGCETNLNSDVNNCKTCGNKCPANGGQPTCNNGVCGLIGCNIGFADCNLNPLDGCEVSLSSDVKNCGGCGKVCSSNHIDLPACQIGACSGACAIGYSDCNKNKASDGCETKDNTGTNCAHSPCAVGAKLMPGCDVRGCVAAICAKDAFCCNNTWDQTCTGYVASVCNIPCTCF